MSHKHIYVYLINHNHYNASLDSEPWYNHSNYWML